MQSDFDSTLSLKALLIYDDIVKMQYKLPEQQIVTTIVN